MQLLNKVVIIGAGNVGEAIGYTLMLRRQMNEIVFVDVDRNKAHGAALDVGHATTYVGEMAIKSGGYEECADAEIIIITAGARRKPGQTRLELAKTNISIMTSITKSIMEYAKDPIIIVVSNPVDLMTYVVTKVSGLPTNRVIGSGTALDTARLRDLISTKLKIDVNDISAFILGEHGDSQVPVWSGCTVAGVNIKEYLERLPEPIEFDYETIGNEVRDAGAEIIAAKGATFYGVAMAVARLVEAIVGNQHALMSVSHVLRRPLPGIEGNLAISLVCCIGREGIVRTMRYGMSDEDREKVYASAAKMAEFVKECFNE